MNAVLVGMEYAKAINTTQIESTVGRTEYGIFYVFVVQSTVQLIEPGETDVLILRIYVDACDTVLVVTQMSRYLSSIMPWIKLLLNPFSR